jgi:hypothetical protein
MESVSTEGSQHELRYADHLSGFSHIALLKQRESREVGQRMLEIVSASIKLEILQSCNGLLH